MKSDSRTKQRFEGAMDRLRTIVDNASPRKIRGRVRYVVGGIVHTTVTDVRVGELCYLVDSCSNQRVLAEVVGIADDCSILTPIGDISGMSKLTEVIPSGNELRIPVGPGLMGRSISAVGEPLDGYPLSRDGIEAYYPVNASPPLALERPLISTPITLGIRSIDGLLTCGHGQRIGIFGEPGVGKSTVMANISRNTDADVVVFGLIGERGREVREFLDRQLSPEAQEKSVFVVSTSDRPAMERVKASYAATTIAEYFRDQGKNVLLLIDSITRFARALREIGLAAGEPPARRGFPPSIFSALPRLLERAGPAENGSITGIYTILVEGDGTLDPIAEEVQAILDGHVILSRELAQRDQFPAVDVLKSRSRLMENVASDEHKYNAMRVRELMSRYAEIELLLRVGEYQEGNDATADEAVQKHEAIQAFLRQRSDERFSMEEVNQQMQELVQ